MNTDIVYILIAFYILYYTGTLHKLFLYLSVKYTKLVSLKDLVSTRHKNWIMIFYISLKLLVKSMYIYLCQLLNKSVVKLNLDMYEVNYVIRGKLYKVIVKPKRGYDNILQVIDENSNDVTSNVLSYHGPNRNWHGMNYTPEMLGYKSLTFMTIDCTEHTFEKNEVFTHI